MSEEFAYPIVCRCGETILIKEEKMIDLKCPKCGLKIKGSISKTASFLSFG